MAQKIKSFFYLFLPLILGGLTSFLIRGNIDFDKINKPPLAPPAILFPIVWTILYLFLGISYFLYKKEYEEKSETDLLYYLGLFFNYTWAILFFNLKLRSFAVVWILILFLLTFFLIKSYMKKKKISGYMLIPYLLWILFATYLNLGIAILN